MFRFDENPGSAGVLFLSDGVLSRLNASRMSAFAVSEAALLSGFEIDAEHAARCG
jgi:hypothetical protein